jgi:hypothetical protein
LPLHGFYLWRHVHCRQSRNLYHGRENLKYYLTPLTRSSSLISWAALTTNSKKNGTQSAHKGKGWWLV